jgi:ribosomal-protein-alanine N-acetyltransferase
MITLREMQIDDLAQVMVIENENFAVPWSETGFFSFLLREDAIFVVAEEQDTIIGYSGIVTVLEEGDITNVAVRKDRQGEGIGRKLVEELKKRAQKAGVTTIYLEARISNERAITLYTNMGFERLGIRKGYYEQPVEDAITMVYRQTL